MRSTLVAIVVFVLLPVVLFRPYIGILLWSWLGYMNPHRLTWGFAYDFPFAYIVAIVTLIGGIVAGQFRKPPLTGLTVTWMIFLGWMCLTTVYAFHRADAVIQLERVMKIQLMTFVTIMLMYERRRLQMLIWVIVLSLGYFGVKGGVFTILTAGAYTVWGPAGSYVEGNNEIALALLMVLPLMQYLRMTSHNRWIRLGLLMAMVLCAFSVVGSQSRGALVGGCAMAVFLLIKSKRKLLTGVALVLLIPILWSFMPDKWHDRMRTIQEYEADASAVSRLQTWQTALRVANDKPLGGGFGLWSTETFERYSPGADVYDAHSIYFKVLGEHGWIGFALFLAIGFMGWRTGTRIIREVRDRPDLRWLSDFARMIQVSLAAFATGGAFLSLSYFDLYWHLIGMLVLAAALLRRELARRTTPAAEEANAAIDYARQPGLAARQHESRA
jgi:putative inorganic carbon (hco3(-)) transporter